MTAFKDATGAEWKIGEISFGFCLRLKKESDGRFNLLEPAGAWNGDEKNPLIQVLQYDLAVFWELLCYLLGDELKARSMSPEAFADVLLAGDFTAAQDAFFREWLDFFQKLRQPVQAALLEKAEVSRDKAIKIYRARMMDPALDAEVERAMEEALSRSFGNAVASLGSTPAPSQPVTSA